MTCYSRGHLVACGIVLVGVLGLNGDDKCGVVVGEAFKAGCELFKG